MLIHEANIHASTVHLFPFHKTRLLKGFFKMVSAVSSKKNASKSLPLKQVAPSPLRNVTNAQQASSAKATTATSMKTPTDKARLKTIARPETPPVEMSPKEVWDALSTYPQDSDFEATAPVYYSAAPCKSINNVKAKAFNNGEIQDKEIALHANFMKPDADQGAVIMAQAPHTPDSVWEHWHSIFEHKADVIEIIEPRTKSTYFNPQFADYGLNFIHNAMLQKGQMPQIHIGDYQVTQIQELPKPKHPKEAQLKERQFALEVKNKKTQEVQHIKYRIVETEYSNRFYTAESLQAMVKDQDHSKTRWITSQTGVARPAAFVVADATRQDSLWNDIKNKHELHLKVMSYVQRGRNIRGPRFIHRQEQLAELYRFGQMRLNMPVSKTKLNPVDATKADIDQYPVRWVKYMDGRPHKPVGNAKVFKSSDQVYNFQTIIGHLRGALWV